MNRKIFLTGLCLILIACVAVGCYISNNNNNSNNDNGNNIDHKRTVKESLLGKTPHSYQCTFGEDFVLYKDYVLKNDEKVFSGLYRYNLNNNEYSDTKTQMLSDSFFACANIYRDKIIFINDEFKIIQMDMENNNSKILYDNNGKAIMDALMIDHYLYFIVECQDNVYNLLALDLTNNIQKKIIEDINPHYMYYYDKGVAVVTKDHKFLSKCNFDDGVVEKYPAPKDEIQGFFDDGNILLVQNCETIYRLKDFYSDEKTVLLQMKNIYRTIMHTDELLICTLDDYGLMEIYIYDFASKKSTKIANANSTPLDFNKNYVICGDEGIGLQELINRSTGKFDNIVTNDTKKEQDDENSLGNIEEGDYKNAISDNELNDLLKIITQYYQNKLSWEVVDYRIADHNHSFYQLYNDYGLGNIIVFEVHTTYNPSGLYRAIALGRKKSNAKWEVLNEGI